MFKWFTELFVKAEDVAVPKEHIAAPVTDKVKIEKILIFIMYEFLENFKNTNISK